MRGRGVDSIEIELGKVSAPLWTSDIRMFILLALLALTGEYKVCFALSSFPESM